MSHTTGIQRLKRLLGGPVLALDGDVGTVKDFYFDDDTWTVRYVVVDTGKWLSGRLVLIPLWALHAPDWDQARIPVRLTRAQVQRSPDIDTHRPVSRQAEATSLSYYGYPFYWGGPALWGALPAWFGCGRPATANASGAAGRRYARNPFAKLPRSNGVTTSAHVMEKSGMSMTL